MAITRKLIPDGKGITLLIGEDVNLLRGTFLVGETSKFLAVWWDSPTILRVSHIVSGQGGQSTPVGFNKATSKEGAFSVRRGIQGYNSGR